MREDQPRCRGSRTLVTDATGASRASRSTAPGAAARTRRSRSHGLRRELLAAQARAIGVPISFAPTGWDGYEEALRAELRAAAAQGLRVGIFGDIDIERHREWVEAAAESAGTRARLPLWRRDRAALVHELLDLGFRAVLVAVRDGVLPPALLGETLDAALLRRLERAGVDLAGENGEFHSCVVDGPIFSEPVVPAVGERSLRDGVWFVDLLPRRGHRDGAGLGSPASG